jgi:hypothetical protein
MWPGPESRASAAQNWPAFCIGNESRTSPLDALGKLFRLRNVMQSPLVVDALREQLLRVLDWYQKSPPGFHWGTVIHRRNERGKLRFGAVTPQGESLLLSEPLLAELGSTACWLDGAVRVRLECRTMGESQPWIDAFARPSRPRMVEALAVYFDPDTSREETMAFQAMAGVLTPAQCPSELFVLTRKRPPGWPA